MKARTGYEKEDVAKLWAIFNDLSEDDFNTRWQESDQYGSNDMIS